MKLYCTILTIYKKDIKFSMRFKTYLLFAIAFIWLVFGAMFLYRSSWDLDDAKLAHGSIIEFGVKEFDPDLHRYALCFKVHGNDQTFGFYQKKNQLYTDYLKMMKIGDSAKVYYNDWKLQANAINFQLVHLETPKDTILNYADRKSRDLWLGLLFTFLGLLSAGLARFILRKKIHNQETEFLGL